MNSDIKLPPGWTRQTIEDLTGPGVYIEKSAGKLKTPACWLLTDDELVELLRKAFDQGASLNTPDAERYRWLRDQQPNSLILSRNDGNAPNYSTVKQWVEEYVPDQYADVPADELERMKDADTDWALQIYPRTPISFDVWHAATLDAVIDAARAQPTNEGEPT